MNAIDSPIETWISPARHVQRCLAAHGRRMAQFGLVGMLGVLINTALLALFVEIGGWHPTAGAALATEVAILGNFTLNDRWTFRDAQPERTWLQRATRYNVVALGGLLLSVGVLTTLMHGQRLHYLVANLFAISASFVWNYALNSWLTWSKAHGNTPAPANRWAAMRRPGLRRRSLATVVVEGHRPWS